MTTPFEKVYSIFISKIDDADFRKLSQEELEDILYPYLSSACVKFSKCKKDLEDRDDEGKYFAETLSSLEIEILANLVLVEYLTPKLITSDLMKQIMNTKDFKIYSQQNQIAAIRETRDSFKREADQLIVSYTFSYLGER